MKSINQKIIKTISSKWFLLGVFILFALQAAWVALSFRYPLIYDESYHFLITQYFSNQLSPWIDNQPAYMDIHGALERQPHLLYHYLMSFPLRVIDLFTSSQFIQIIALRFINIALFIGGLWVFSRLFKQMNISPALSNIAILFLTLLPITSYVAATINYDNAVFLLTALFMLLGVKIIKSKSVQWHNVATLALVAMTGCLVKNVFIPIVLGGGIFLLVWAIVNRKKVFPQLYKSFLQTALWIKIGLLIISLPIMFLFTERLIVNVVSYKSISPICTKQMPSERCSKNGIYARGVYLRETRNERGVPKQGPEFTMEWLSFMSKQILWTGAKTETALVFVSPLPLLFVAFFLLSTASILVIAYAFDLIRRKPGFWYITLITVVYLIALFYTNISAYNSTYQVIGTQGRYLLPILLVLMVFAVVGFNYALRYAPSFKLPVLIVVSIVFLSGGAGLITHIVRSDSTWYWDDTWKMQIINNESRELLQPIIKEWWYER